MSLNNPTSGFDPSGHAFHYIDSINKCLSGSIYAHVGGNSTGVSSGTPSGGPDGVPLSIGGLFQSILNFFKKNDTISSELGHEQPYNYNGSKNEVYVRKRGWTDEMIQYAMDKGQRGTSVNRANNSSCTVYKYPGKSNQYVVIDDSTGSIVQVSDFFDLGWKIDSSIKWAP